MEQDSLMMRSFSKRSMLLLAVMATLFLIYNYLSWRSDMHETAPLLDQIMEVKFNLMSNHVLFEEMARGYLNVKPDEVQQSVERTRQMAADFLKGSIMMGGTQGRIPGDALLQSNMSELHHAIHKIATAMGQVDHSAMSGDSYHHHDILFDDALAFAQAADVRVHDLIADKLQRQQMIFSLALAVWLVIMIFILLRWNQLSARFVRSNAQLSKLSHAVEQTGESILIANRDGTIEYVNPAFTKVTGYESEEVLGKNPSLLSSGKQDSRFYKKMWSAILAGQVWQGEVVDKRKDGSLYRAELSISPIMDELNQVHHFVAIQRDITELREVQESLVQAKKMDAIGTMCCGLAHDMNNTLSIVIGNIELVQMDEEISDKAKELLVQAEGAGFMAATMIQDLLSYSSKSISAFELLDIARETRKLKTLLQTMCSHVQLDLEVGRGQLFILGDKQHFHRIFTNLIKNACDALEKTALPRISIRLQAVTADELAHKQQLEHAGHWLCLSIADNGHGIAAETLEKIYDPFFTTKAVGKGTGLGLSSVFGMMQSHRGFIDVESSVGEGTIFKLYFPDSTACHAKP